MPHLDERGAQRLIDDDAIAKVRSLLPAFQSAMVVTRSIRSSVPSVRPMALQGDPAAFAGTLWFFTDSRSRKAMEIAAEPQTSVILQCDKSSAYLHLAGRSTLVIDRAKMRELFTPKLKTWFPNGLDDPYLTLMRFDADGGYFWDGVGGRLQALGALTRALVTGIPGRTVEAGRLML